MCRHYDRVENVRSDMTHRNDGRLRQGTAEHELAFSHSHRLLTGFLDESEHFVLPTR